MIAKSPTPIDQEMRTALRSWFPCLLFETSGNEDSVCTAPNVCWRSSSAVLRRPYWRQLIPR